MKKKILTVLNLFSFSTLVIYIGKPLNFNLRFKFLLILFFSIFCTTSKAQTLVHAIPSSNPSFPLPAGIDEVTVEAWGGGGGGGAALGGNGWGRGAAGGAGGAYALGKITGIITSTLNVVVAKATASSSSNGANGEPSYVANFTDVFYAPGGAGGSANLPATGNTPPNGASATTGSIGNLTTANGSASGGGYVSLLNVALSSGNGGGAGNPGPQKGGAGGLGYASLIGANGAGNPGQEYGGGGAGAASSLVLLSSSTLYNGGIGARGHVNITYTCKTYSFTGISAANVCTAIGTTSQVQLTGTSTTLPAGTYTVTYNRSSPSFTGLTATMTVGSNGSGSFTAVGLNVSGTSTITVTSLTSVDCTSAISTNNSVNVIVGAQPTLTLGATTAVCASSNLQSTTLPYSNITNLPSTYSITWNASPTNSFLPVANAALTASPINIQIPANTPGGTYTGNLTVANTAGCISPTYSFTVTVNSLPAISLGSIAGVCTSASLQNVTLPYTAPANSPTSYSIVWNASPTNNFGTITDASLPANSINITVPAGTAAGTYTGTLTVKNANGCISTPSNFTVTVNPLPSITLGTANEVCFSASAQTSSLSYSASTNSPTLYSIVWNASPTNNFLAVTDATLTASPISISVPAGTAMGIYTGTLTVKNANGCISAPSNFTVTVNPLPSITLGTANAVCFNASAQTSSLSYSAPTNSPTSYSIVWNASPTNNFLAVTDATLNASPINIAVPAGTAAGTYTGTLTVKNANGCISTPSNFTVTVNQAPTITTSGNLTSVCQNVLAQTASLPYSATTGTPISYSIDWAVLNDQGATAFSFDSAGGIINNITIPANAAVGTYSGVMTIFTSNNCQTTQAISLTINSLPTINTAGVFTPVCQSLSAQTTTLSYSSTTGSPINYAIDWVALTDQGTTPFPFSSGSGDIINVNVPANTTAGTYNGIMTITTSGGCQASQNVSLTVNAVAAAPTAFVTQLPTCVNNTGVITVTSPASGTGYTYSIDGVDFSNTSGVFAGLSSGGYNVQVRNSTSGCVSQATPIMINAFVTKAWNGSADGNWENPANWTPTGVPISSDCVDIPKVGFDPIISGTNASFLVSRLTVQNNGSLVVQGTNTITVTNEVNVLGNGTLIFENNSSLVQINDVDNTGNITYKRNTTPVRRYDVTYWSSPVTRVPAFTLHDLSPNTLWDKYHKFNSVTEKWILISNGAEEMVKGNGYSIRSPQFYDLNSTQIFGGQFKGVPNNGTILGPSGAAEKLIFLGNPYPSAIYADQFIHDNADRLYGTLYFWTHNSPPTLIPGTNTYTYTGSDFAYYNLSGLTEVGTMEGTGATSPGNQSEPKGYIAAGQGFFAKSRTGQNPVYTNSMRVANNNSQFYKSANTTLIEKHRVWLNLTNTEGAFKQLLIGYVTGATNSFDYNYDAVTLNANPYVDFYSINEDKKLVIQGRAVPFVVTDTIPIGYKSTIPEGNFTIAIDHTDGSLSTQNIYLQDNVTNTIHNLKTGGYTFRSAPGTFLNRFVLRYTNNDDGKSLGNEDFENQDQNIVVSVKDKNIRLQSVSEQENLQEAAIYDMGGKQLYLKKRIGNKEWIINNFQSGPQILLVKMTLDNGKTVTRKIVFR
ncbi:T9SS sorting signal type C domain-containing protein [Flavobacterium sp. KACC 22763]|uniref:T9SS sorting signal type C domain-containing protein n=1 Tax=Flavobacterium sp. KACC 22763 TaxID=3025668 RepID=UPI002366CF9E|nr:T9SS sorting signal type C domain-containing protein [Flavobacterium sp. KACC 22763]WDF63316.1 T9SS sorting signal type C domain-containing protein [Flavobacterium sp. KACC 22763]